MLYLAYYWGTLPEQVPTHWNIKGEIDGYGSKLTLVFLAALPLMTYLVLVIVPAIDPRGKLHLMGNKYHNIRLWLTVLMAAVSLFIVYSARMAAEDNTYILVLLLGGMFVVLGNYFKTIKANYFVGIRTPWTLESESVWKATHAMAGQLWFVGGIIVMLGSVVLPSPSAMVLLLGVALVIALVPVVYSYWLYRQEARVG